MKDRKTYLTLCAVGGWCGLHQFYLLRYGKGILYMFTFGLFGIGWIRDLLFAYQDVDRYNASRGFVNTGVRDPRGY